VGAITGACLVLGRRTLVPDGSSLAVPKLLLLLATLAILLKFRKVPEPVIIAGAAILGLVIHPFVAR